MTNEMRNVKCANGFAYKLRGGMPEKIVKLLEVDLVPLCGLD